MSLDEGGWYCGQSSIRGAQRAISRKTAKQNSQIVASVSIEMPCQTPPGVTPPRFDGLPVEC